jgi:hypothetical protein
MKKDLHLHLDGESSLEGLDDSVQQEADAWDRLLEAFRTEMPSSPPPPWLESKVMAEIESLPQTGMFRRLAEWLWVPKSIRLSPLLVGVAAVVLLFAATLRGPGDPMPPPGTVQEVVVYVQFALDAPGAQSVSVAGDFDGWTGSFSLQDANGDGTWTGRIPLQPGVHAYMFLVDGSTWVTDPLAQRYADDGFGNRNAILAVAHPSV